MVCLYSILCTLAGLLAGLWEFPCTAVKPDCPVQRTWRLLQKCLSVETEQHTFQGTVGMTPTCACTPLTQSCVHTYTITYLQVSHQFSHTLHHYHVWHILTSSPPPHLASPPHKWVTVSQLLQSAISTAIRKVSYKLCTDTISCVVASSSNSV